MRQHVVDVARDAGAFGQGLLACLGFRGPFGLRDGDVRVADRLDTGAPGGADQHREPREQTHRPRPRGDAGVLGERQRARGADADRDGQGHGPAGGIPVSEVTGQEVGERHRDARRRRRQHRRGRRNAEQDRREADIRPNQSIGHQTDQKNKRIDHEQNEIE